MKISKGIKMDKPSLEQYCLFLEITKERFGLLSYEIENDKVIVFYLKEGYEENVVYLFWTKYRPESITSGRAEIVSE